MGPYRVYGSSSVEVTGTVSGGSLNAASSVSVNISSCIAVKMAGSGTLNPGDVVVIDFANDNSVIATTVADSGPIVGVVTSAPGVILNSSMSGGYAIAVQGITSVHVTGTATPISRGDLLSTSTTLGWAKKAVANTNGTILGYALQGTSADGFILVMLSPH
jgi:hypothetical protein